MGVPGTGGAPELLDLSLATREAETPWLTFVEPGNLFGARAHAAEALAATTRRALLAKVAALAVTLAALAAPSPGWWAARRGTIVPKVPTPKPIRTSRAATVGEKV